MLAMAHGFATGGMIPGILTVLFCGATAYLGLLFLALCARHPDVKPRGASFAALSALTYPAAGVFFDAAIAIKCFGVSISYLIIFGALMAQVVRSFERVGAASAPAVLLDRRFWITVAMIILVPLSFLRKVRCVPTAPETLPLTLLTQLDSLRYTSYVALVAVADLILVVVYKFFDRSGLDPPGDIYLVHLSPSFVAALPVYIFAYTCAQNLFAIHNELKSNTHQRINYVLTTSIGSAAVIYEILGILGYLTFGSNVSSNLISDYHNSMFIAICRLAISILVLFSYPLQLHPCRASLDKVFASRKEGDELQDDHAAREIPLAKYVAMTSGILLASFLIAVNVRRLETVRAFPTYPDQPDADTLARQVLGFVGSTGSTTISFILPSLFYLRLFPSSPSSSDKRRRLMRFLAVALLIWGVLVFVVCLSLNVIEAVRPGLLIGKYSFIGAATKLGGGA